MGGNPTEQSVQVEGDTGLVDNIDDDFVILSFTGGEQYFALDGQHRLKAIKDAVKVNDASPRRTNLCTVSSSQ